MVTKRVEVLLLDQIWRISGTVSRDLEAVLQDLIDCSLPQFLVMRTLAALPPEQGAFAATDIAKALRCTKANAGQLVTRLEEAGRIKKSRGGADGRVVALRLTAKGEQHYEMCERTFATEAKLSFTGLDAEERQQLLALLRKVTLTSPPS